MTHVKTCKACKELITRRSWTIVIVTYQRVHELSKITVNRNMLRNTQIPRRTESNVMSGPIPAQKLLAHSVPKPVFSHLMPKMDFCYFHRFSWEKNTLNWYITCHSYINNHSSPFIGPIEIDRTYFKKNSPFGLWRPWNEM